jgi:hypothetical protein
MSEGKKLALYLIRFQRIIISVKFMMSQFAPPRLISHICTPKIFRTAYEPSDQFLSVIVHTTLKI